MNEVEEDGYAISNLPTGAYRFDAKTTVSGKTEEISGQFVIQKNEQELLHTTADFGLLREISSKSGGASLNNNGMVAKIKEMQENRPPDKLESSESLMDIIHLKWLFFLLVALLSLEWGTRKYLGEY